MSSEIASDKTLQAADPGEVRVARALLSVSDKTGIVEFARGLVELGVELVSTGGTQKALTDAGIPVRGITDLTGFPEIMDGRVKTLNPKLYAGLLAVRSDPAHVAAAADNEVEPVDLVCVNLYPFEQTVARQGVSDAEVIENIDIGGPTMIRAAAKNYLYAAPVVSPERYEEILEELRGTAGKLSIETRESLARDAFVYTARYDSSISQWFQLSGGKHPPVRTVSYEQDRELSYGENPHQSAAYYTRIGARAHLLSNVEQLHGKQLSFNNLLDLDSARLVLSEFSEPACVIVKHNNPCGVALGSTAVEAYQRAFAGDPTSAFGGVIVLNRRVDKAAAEAIVGQFLELLLAPGFDDDALEVLKVKPNLRILDDRETRLAQAICEPAMRQVIGGMLVQDRDLSAEDRATMTVASERQPTEAEWAELLFAWKVCKHVKSNAIVLSKDNATVGLGAGQMSRVDSVRIAVEKSVVDVSGTVLASDAYFPFPDGPQLALDAGVAALIQPGGSIRDELTIDAVNAAGATMVFTGHRHFRH